MRCGCGATWNSRPSPPSKWSPPLRSANFDGVVSEVSVLRPRALQAKGINSLARSGWDRLSILPKCTSGRALRSHAEARGSMAPGANSRDPLVCVLKRMSELTCGCKGMRETGTSTWGECPSVWS